MSYRKPISVVLVVGILYMYVKLSVKHIVILNILHILISLGLLLKKCTTHILIYHSVIFLMEWQNISHISETCFVSSFRYSTMRLELVELCYLEYDMCKIEEEINKWGLS